MNSRLQATKEEPVQRAARLTDRQLAPMLTVAWVVILFFVVYTQLTPWPDVALLTDFQAFWTAGSLVKQGAGPDLYNLDLQRDTQVTLRRELGTQEMTRGARGLNRFHNPPPLALLFVPLAFLPLPSAFLVWSVFTVLACTMAVALLLRGATLGGTRAIALLSYIGLVDNLLWGQVGGVFLLALGSGLLALTAGQRALGGALLGLLWLKPQYAPLFALVFLVKGRWRELAGMACTGLVIVGLSLAIVGPEGVLAYPGMVTGVGGFYAAKGASIGPELMINWRAVLIHLWPGVSEATGYAAMVGLGAVIVALVLTAWGGRWQPDSARFPLQMLVTTLATLVVTPHSHFSGTILVLGPLALAMKKGIPDGPLASLWRPLLGLGYLLSIVVWVALYSRWVLGLYFVMVMAVLVLQCRRTPPAHPSRHGVWLDAADSLREQSCQQ